MITSQIANLFTAIPPIVRRVLFVILGAYFLLMGLGGHLSALTDLFRKVM